MRGDENSQGQPQVFCILNNQVDGEAISRNAEGSGVEEGAGDQELRFGHAKFEMPGVRLVPWDLGKVFWL